MSLTFDSGAYIVFLTVDEKLSSGPDGIENNVCKNDFCVLERRLEGDGSGDVSDMLH